MSLAKNQLIYREPSICVITNPAFSGWARVVSSKANRDILDNNLLMEEMQEGSPLRDYSLAYQLITRGEAASGDLATLYALLAKSYELGGEDQDWFKCSVAEATSAIQLVFNS